MLLVGEAARGHLPILINALVRALRVPPSGATGCFTVSGQLDIAAEFQATLQRPSVSRRRTSALKCSGSVGA
jgi:hypothetical protein